MLHDYLRSSWRGVLHNKVATFINVGGLALGLTVFFALILYVEREFSWDAHWEGADRIYQIYGQAESPRGNAPAIISQAPYYVGTSLQNRNPGAFDVYVRLYQSVFTVAIDGTDYPNLALILAEPELLGLVQLESLEGSLPEVFADPRAVALSRRVAERYFGDESPLGKTLTFTGTQGSKTDRTVKAVFLLPDPSSMAYIQFLGLLDTGVLPQANVSLDIWNSPPQSPPDSSGAPSPPPVTPFNVAHYFKLNEGVDAEAIAADVRAVMDANRYMTFGEDKLRYVFRKLRDLHLRSPNLFNGGDNVQRLWLYAAIAILVLLISGCNFVMLATLRSVDRMREIGIRKTVGGEAGQLLRQYLVDAFCHTLLAAVLAIFLLQLALPRMQVALGLPLQIDLWTWKSFGLCLTIVAGFTLVSGAYPALLMSKGRPAALLINSSSAVLASGNGLRRMLVAIQFAIVIVLLLASAVVQQQIRYTQNRDRGFSLDNVVALRLNNLEWMMKSSALITEFSRVPGVLAAAAGSVSPGSITVGGPPPVRRITEDGRSIEAAIQGASVGADYFRALSVPVVAGREFSVAIDGQPAVPGAEPVLMRNVLLNVSAVRDLGFASPEMAIEQLLETETRNQQGEVIKQTLRVIGVVADTQFSSVMLPPVAQIYSFSAQAGFVAVKLEPGADTAAVTSMMESAWHSVLGTAVFLPLVPEQMDGNMLRREEFEARIIIGSTLLAMVIALLGLYGLVAATVVKREKEIGVRKVMGADRKSIVALLLWQFSKPVLVANLIAWPLGFWGIRQWLQRFPYQLDTPQVVLAGLSASIVALLIAWLTVGCMAAKAASAKPVLALRNE